MYKLKPLSFGSHWSQYSRFGRIVFGAAQQQHQQQVCLKHQEANDTKPLYDWKYGRGKHNDSRFHQNGVKMLAGVVGAAAVLSIGTALCESQEEQQKNTSSPEATGNDLKQAQDGEDVVGTNRYRYSKKRERDEKSNSNISVKTCRENKLEEAIKQSRKLLKRRMEEAGAPGLVVAVSVNGETIWADGLGFADLENNVRCTPATVMRIASISKSLTMTAVAKLWEEGKLDIDAPVQKYIPNFPVKKYDGEEVTITTRHLLSHQSGIRHYKLKDPNKKDEKHKNCEKDSPKTKSETTEEKEGKGKKVLPKNKSKENQSNGKHAQEKVEELHDNEIKENEHSIDAKSIVDAKKAELAEILKSNGNKKKNKKKEEEENEFDMQEYYIKKKFDSIQEALMLFQNDDLFFKPGTGFLYTTHGWTVVSGVVEGAAGKPFTQVITKMFYDLGLENTYLDKNEPIIYNRASIGNAYLLLYRRNGLTDEEDSYGETELRQD